jgi:hypothetical protein
VINQNNKNFTWLICLDTETDPHIIEILNSIKRNHRNIKLLLINGYRNFLPVLKKHIAESLSDTPYIITSRLDNDDAIRYDYIDRIQNNFNKQEKCLIDFPNGLCLEIEPNFRLSYRKMEFNPFLSLIENSNDFKTVMHYFSHLAWKKEKVTLNKIKNTRTWLQIIHNRNKLNSFKGNILTGNINQLNDFNVLPVSYYSRPGLGKKIAHYLRINATKTINRLRFIKKRFIKTLNKNLNI